MERAAAADHDGQGRSDGWREPDAVDPDGEVVRVAQAEVDPELLLEQPGAAEPEPGEADLRRLHVGGERAGAGPEQETDQQTEQETQRTLAFGHRALRQDPARPGVERPRRPPDHVETHRQGGQALAGRVVQVECKTPSFLILQGE